MRVAMIGTGYVGLVSGACFADFGHEVTCVDKDTGKIAALARGEMPIYEPGLPELVATNARGGRLKFTNDLPSAVKAADAVFIAVGTPSRRGDGHADLSFVHDAAREIAAALDGFTVVITKSTVPVGTGDEVERIIRETRPQADVAVVSNPEFLREGAAIQDFKHPDRIVVGTSDARARERMTELYRPLYLNRSPILFTDRRTAELIKYAANAFLATKITFINEIADLAEKVGADVQEIARGIGLDNRIGSKFLHAGPGFGGSCFKKDILNLVYIARTYGLDEVADYWEQVIDLNDYQKRRFAQNIISKLNNTLSGKKIAMLGWAFKKDTNDTRESAAIYVADHLLNEQAEIHVYDPKVSESQIHKDLDYLQTRSPEENRAMVQKVVDIEQAVSGAHAVAILTEWDEFKTYDWAKLSGLMMKPAFVFDGRNILDHEALRALGVNVYGIGR